MKIDVVGFVIKIKGKINQIIVLNHEEDEITLHLTRIQIGDFTTKEMKILMSKIQNPDIEKELCYNLMKNDQILLEDQAKRLVFKLGDVETSLEKKTIDW